MFTYKEACIVIYLSCSDVIWVRCGQTEQVWNEADAPCVRAWDFQIGEDFKISEIRCFGTSPAHPSHPVYIQQLHSYHGNQIPIKLIWGILCFWQQWGPTHAISRLPHSTWFTDISFVRPKFCPVLPSSPEWVVAVRIQIYCGFQKKRKNTSFRQTLPPSKWTMLNSFLSSCTFTWLSWWKPFQYGQRPSLRKRTILWKHPEVWGDRKPLIVLWGNFCPENFWASPLPPLSPLCSFSWCSAALFILSPPKTNGQWAGEKQMVNGRESSIETTHVLEQEPLIEAHSEAKPRPLCAFFKI